MLKFLEDWESKSNVLAAGSCEEKTSRDHDSSELLHIFLKSPLQQLEVKSWAGVSPGVREGVEDRDYVMVEGSKPSLSWPPETDKAGTVRGTVWRVRDTAAREDRVKLRKKPTFLLGDQEQTKKQTPPSP